jgi:hypothetical protein
MKTRLLTLGVAALGVLGVARWMIGGGETAPSEPVPIFDRIWVDRLPTKPKDTANIFIALTRQPMGIFQFASQWKGGYEIFQYTAKGDDLRISYPQTDERDKVRARAWKCKQRDMDYCLELGGASRGVQRYYSKVGWEIDGATPAEQLPGRAAAMTHP